MIKLYNSLTKRVEELQPVNPGKIKMYVCGPTVYNYFHIGNARTFLMFDVIRQYLKQRGYDVTYVQNFTDIDDKLIVKANELGITVKELAEDMIIHYFEDARALRIKDADYHPKATETIDEIIKIIQGLIDKGLAYIGGKDVFFDTEKFKEYGKLSGQNLDKLEVGSRVEVDVNKKNPLDFVLWKSAKPGEPKWQSPWGEGRPGWHIECSAMSKKHLGETIDIHGGGEDLAFPHHENEIAQSEGLSGKTFAKYWLHVGFLQIDNKKMSKSEGNSLMVRDLRQKFSPLAIRLFLMSGHYRNPINFSEELLQGAQRSVERINTAYNNLNYAINSGREQELDFTDQETLTKADELVEKYFKVMDDDFNTADGLSVLFELVREINIYLQRERNNLLVLKHLRAAFERINQVFDLLWEKEENLNSEIENLIEERQQARKAKNFKRADEIRDQLLSMGIILEDTKNGVRWKFVGKE
ncbi:cysteinyl-tRNA synthetase [Anaerobranca californiensis DSM 14826]|jgi:cysteinyl-tRNA synthetase|uniref:Cysteine--tRNA ligase n=1 Tax=Anaerobranca californiensis DSM 14826 TaxID=1120989 RepID=A0A1M6QYT0_9FIRM|nr:cysteinyl-tRNA synthetase [Anaerobranca californiensis DSM 14826]